MIRLLLRCVTNENNSDLDNVNNPDHIISIATRKQKKLQTRGFGFSNNNHKS